MLLITTSFSSLTGDGCSCWKTSRQFTSFWKKSFSFVLFNDVSERTFGILMSQPARGKDMGLLCLHSFIYFIGENLVLGFQLLCPLALVSVFPLLWYTVSSRVKIPKFGQSHALIRAPKYSSALACH